METVAALMLVIALLALGALAVTVGLWHRAGTRAAALDDELAQRARELGAHQVQLRELVAERERYRPIIDVEGVVASLQTTVAAGEARVRELQAQVGHLNGELTSRQQQLALVAETENLNDVGFYRARYSFVRSDEYKVALDEVAARQEAMVKAGTAAVTTKSLTFNGSEAKGKKTQDELLRLMLRAFNGESDAGIARVTYRNIDAMQKRIERAAEAINRFARNQACEIADAYVLLKVQELVLTHEYQEKVQAERDEQRAIRAQMAEEAREDREREKALKEAAKDEERFADALAAAQAQLETASAAVRQKLESEVAQLQQRLLEAQRKKSQAQLTRSGHVYVISNVGSFGDGIYKIGMTRRLEPMDRVWELSDASVPFDFDVHALIYTEDAPALENALHRHFDVGRVNKLNLKREFFRATLLEIEAATKRSAPTAKIEFTLAAEAEEWRKSIALHEAQAERRAREANTA